MLRLAKREEYQMSDFANVGPASLTGSISLQRSYGATRADLNYTDTKLISHKVQANDTLQSLAVKYGVTVEKLKRINKIWSNESLFLKETIMIPFVAPINKWEDDHDDGDDDHEGDDDDGSNGDGDSESLPLNKGEIKTLKKQEIESKDDLENASHAESSKIGDERLSSETNCSEFLLNIDDRIKKCKNEWKRKENQNSSKSQVPCVSYDSMDVNKMSPTKTFSSDLEKI